MTGDERAAIKAVLDAYARRVYEADGLFLDRCAECGGERLGWTLGCKACANRHQRRHKEGTHPDPQWFAARAEESHANGHVLRRRSQTAIMERRRDARPARIR